jgi:nucleoside-diphosphate-sugar epimerase
MSSANTPRSRPSLVLITGGTGHVGFWTLLHALRSGHRVRAAVRTEAKAAFLLSRPQIQSLSLADRTRLTFAVVPDITEDAAYDAAVRDVSHIIHIASPLVTGNQVPPSMHDEYFVKPAVRGTRNILEAAKRSGTVRRIVITSSIVALLPVDEMEGRVERTRPVLPTDRVPLVSGPHPSEFASYAASKIAALHEAETWMQRESPSFDIIHLHPSFVQGRNLVASTTGEAMKGTNAVVLAMLLGKQWGGFAGATVHVEDVARVHVEALEPFIPGNQSYILDTASRWDDAKDVVKREFPEAVEKRLLIPSGSCASFDVPFDSSLTERTFGIRFQSFNDQVKSLVGQFLELRMRRIPTSLGPRRAKVGSSAQIISV